MSVDTVARLAKLKNVVAIKEASGNLEQMAKIKKICGNDLSLFSGDDALTLPVLSIGGAGVVSVIANIMPGQVAEMIRAFENKEIERSREIYLDMLEIVKAMFIETNPIPVKTAMSLMGMIEPEIRLPLCEMSKDNLSKLKKTLKKYKLIK
jgi:4-hydroxy-tetrahydrodipicolinate synthase